MDAEMEKPEEKKLNFDSRFSDENPFVSFTISKFSMCFCVKFYIIFAHTTIPTNQKQPINHFNFQPHSTFDAELYSFCVHGWKNKAVKLEKLNTQPT